MIRRLRPGDEQLHVDLARRFKEHAPSLDRSHAFLADDRNHLLVAQSDNGDTVGFALAYVLQRWDGKTQVFLYELEVEAACRTQGYGRALVEEVLRIARAAGASKAWVQADEANAAAMRLYAAAGAARKERDDVLWSWTL